jgi:branched-chain amino acid transport system ATP-binding protein
MPPALQLTGVSRRFGALAAVDKVDMSVAIGERRAVIGPNGAGKTTLFNLITGELPLSAGRVALFGQDVSRRGPHRRAALGLGRTYQITNVFAGLTVEENVALAALGLERRKFDFLGLAPRDAAFRARIEEALAIAGLEGKLDVECRHLSYGEQRQLELAMALAGRPRILLLDEPAAGLSPAERAVIVRLVAGLPRELSLVVIEHDMDLVLSLVDTVTCLHYGQVVATGDPATIRDHPLVQEVYLGTVAAHA